MCAHPDGNQKSQGRAHMTICGRLLAVILLLAPAVAWAQDFPAKPIRLIVPFPPGGPNDIIARVIGQKMSELVRQPIIVDNRGGQGGVLGTEAVAKAAPDGYTVAIASAGALAISPSMENVAYDTLKDLAPMTLVATVPEMPAIIAKLNKIATDAMADPVVKAKLAEQGLTLVGDMPEHFRDFVAADIKKWAKVIQDAGVVTTK
jgi:tripartite-type tricarboxylate transporter receptor subunit TctC